MNIRKDDVVVVLSGKDKGKKAQITRVLPRSEKVVMEDINVYIKHVRKYGTQAGQKMKLARPLSTAKIAILNEKGEPDRIAYQFTASGEKQRIFRKTGTIISENSVAAGKSAKTVAPKAKDKSSAIKTDAAAQTAAKPAKAQAPAKPRPRKKSNV